MSNVGVAINLNVSSEDKGSLISLIKSYDNDFEYNELPHWHSDKVTIIMAQIDDIDVNEFVGSVKELPFCNGVFESFNEDNPLDVCSRKDLYGRQGTFFGDQVDIDDSFDDMSL